MNHWKSDVSVWKHNPFFKKTKDNNGNGDNSGELENKILYKEKCKMKHLTSKKHEQENRLK